MPLQDIMAQDIKANIALSVHAVWRRELGLKTGSDAYLAFKTQAGSYGKKGLCLDSALKMKPSAHCHAVHCFACRSGE